jgi:hypothetical protein
MPSTTPLMLRSAPGRVSKHARLVHQNIAWIGDGASFEASLREAPQGEEFFSMPPTAFLMLRSAHRARLEARTTSVR